MKLLATLSLLLFAASQSFAAAACADKYEIFDNTMVQTIPGDGPDGCYITVNPRNIVDMTYRDFLFDDKGLFMIFNSFGNGPESDYTGAREIYFFPRNVKDLGYTYDQASQRLTVTTPSGKTVVFNTEKSILVSISGTSFNQDYDVNKTNNGGIEITKNDGFYLDLGFQVGQSPSQSPTRKVTFLDTAKHTCQVKNSQIFTYTQDDDVIFKFDDAQLTKFLKTSCTNLQL